MTDTVQFELEHSTTGWELHASDSQWVDALYSVLMDTLHVDLIPAQLPFVGHQEIDDVWCVFASAAGSADVRGQLVPSRLYSRLDLDPFVAIPSWLGAQSPIPPLNPDEAPTPTQRVVRPLDVEEAGPEYLRYAYGYYLSCERALRTSTYWSVLPPGVPAKLSPLSCFAAEPSASSAMTLDQLFAPAETTPSAAERPVGSETQKIVIGSTPDTSSDTDAAGNSDWTAVELHKPVEVLDPAPDAHSTTSETVADPPEDTATVTQLRRQLRRLRQMWIASVILLLAVSGVSTWLVIRWSRDQLTELRKTTVRLDTVLQGLDLPDDGRSADEHIRAALRDLSTVSIQSGAWQTGLRSRGAEPEDVLGTLVDLSRLSTVRLARLVEAEARILDVAGNSAPLGRLADAETQIQQLVTVQPALSALAGTEPPLTAIAARSEALEQLATNANALQRLADRSSDLVALAGQQDDLAKLSRHAQVLSTLAAQAADIVTFVERRQRALEALAERSDDLITLADASASVRELVARQRTLERLVRSSSDLFALAESVPLRQLVEERELLAQLERNLSELAALADNAPALLELANQSVSGSE